MRKILLLIIVIFISLNINAQVEKPPIYPGCENIDIKQIEKCFFNKLEYNVHQNFKTPQNVKDDRFQGKISILFSVTDKGIFEVIYVKSAYKELKEEALRVFSELPNVIPANYDGRSVDKRYALPINIPIEPYEELEISQYIAPPVVATIIEPEVIVKEEIIIEDIITLVDNDTLFPEFYSELNIPLTHQEYDEIIYYLDKGENTHTAFKPFLYNEVRPHVDLNAKRSAILKDKNTWAGRKLFNEHLFLIKGKNYWFTVNPTFDLQIGKDNSDIDFTYNNTRAFQIQGALGKKFSFSSSYYESQGRFAQYVNNTTRQYGAIIGASAVVPGRGKAKGFKEGGFDYPVAEAYLSYTPNNFFNFQFGNGKNFIGDGYRTFFLSDVASPYPYFKISTKFWKIKYTNLWMWMDDIRRTSSDDGTNLRKFVAMHHLSWNITDKFNLGLFEAVITNENSYPNGFDISFFNPIIFYRAVEFSNGGDFSGNVQVGLNMKYKINDQISIYNQFLVDELTVSRVFDGSGYIGNKFAIQLGAKYYNAFKIDNLMLQGEFNWARPYTFSHAETTLNSGHYNQPISHMWGANFWEFVGITRYSKNRWFANAKIIIGEKGYDFQNSDINYGGDIYRSYNDGTSETGNEVGQGNTTKIFIGDIQAGWILNPATNLQIFGGFTYRSFSPYQTSSNFNEDNTTWFTIGLRSSLFNWYFDN